MSKPPAETIAWDVHAHLVPVMAGRLGPIEGVSLADGRLEIDGHVLKIGDLYRSDRLIEWMTANGVERALVSTPPPTYRPQLDAEAARLWTAYLNDGLVGICAGAREERLVAMLHMPIQHPSLATEIVERATATSIVHFSLPAGASGDTVLSDPAFEPLWRALDAAAAFVFVHPARCCDGRLAAYYLENLLGNPHETSVAAAHLVFGGVLDRFPNIRFCLAHGGGNLATVAGRWQRGFETHRPGVDKSRTPPAEAIRRFHVDCILHSAEAIHLAAHVFGEKNLQFGSDWPFPMGLTDPHGQLSSVSPELRQRIFDTNARSVLG